MGVEPALARGAIRVSTGPATTEAEIDRFLNVWQTLNKSLSNGVKRGLAA
jgi:cysteine desulfurase